MGRIQKGTKVKCILPQYKNQVFTFVKILGGIFHNNAAQLEDSKGELVVLPLEKLVLID